MDNSIHDGKDPLSFWKRPEGKTGMFFLALIVIGAGIGLFFLLPFIIVLLQNALYAAILGVALAAIIYVALDKRFRRLIWHGYKSVMRFLTGLFIEIDPIGIMKNYLDALRDKQEDLQSQISKVAGVRGRLNKVISSNSKQIELSMHKASVAKKTGRDRQVQLHTRTAGRLESVNQRLGPLAERLEHLLGILAKVDDAVGISIDDLKEEIKVTEMEFESMRAASKAMSQATGALSGSGVDYEFFEMAKDYVEKDVGEKLGQIENYLRISSNIMENLDFKDEVALDKGLRMLETWEQTGSVNLGGREVKADPHLDSKPADSVAEDLGSEGGKYHDVFARFRQENQSRARSGA